MLEYSKFLIKRLYNKKSNLIICLVSLLIIVFTLVMNIRNQSIFEDMIQSGIKSSQEIISINKERYEMDADPYAKKAIEINEKQIKVFESMQNDYDQKNWESLYVSYIEVLEERKNAVKATAVQENSDTFNQLEYFNKDLNYFRYLLNNDLTYENMDYSIYGLTFTTQFFDVVGPISVLLLSVYLMIQLYLSDRKKDLDYSCIIPIGKNKVRLTKLLLGIVISVSIFLIHFIFSLIVSWALTRNSGFNYPFAILGSDGKWIIESININVVKWISMAILFYANVSVFAYLICQGIKEATTSFLVIILVIVGMSYLPNFVPVLCSFAQWLPTTYMRYVSVLNGIVSSSYNNFHITWTFGMLILAISLTFQLIFSMLLIKKD